MLALTLLGCNYGLDLPLPNGGALLKVTPENDVVFPATPSKGQMGSEEVLLRAAGTSPVVIEDLWVDGDDVDNFEVGHLELPTVIQPGEELAVEVHFDPDAVGAFSALLMVDLGSTSELGIERRLIGEGCADSDSNGNCD